MLELALYAFFLSPAFAAEPTDVPAALKVGPGQSLLLQAHGAGDQVYICKPSADGKNAWTLKMPDAQLTDTDGKTVGRHFAGPTWESTDGSRVQGKPAANVPSPDAQSVPWLLLNATSHEGQGVMTSVTQIQRLHTTGGKAPQTGCDDAHTNAETRVAYQADYYFYSGENR